MRDRDAPPPQRTRGGWPRLAIACLDVADRGIGTVCRAVILTTGITLLVSITIGVVARYVIEVGGVDWAVELPRQLFAWFIMAGVVLALQTGNHIAVDLMLHALRPRARRVQIVLINLLIVAAYAYLTVVALQVAEIASIERNPMLGTPGSLPFYALAVGAALTGLAALSLALRVAILGAGAAPSGNPQEESIT